MSGYNSINYRICVLGARLVGKTSLIIRLCSDVFPEEEAPLQDDGDVCSSYRKQAVIDDESCLLEILEPRSDVEYTALRDQSIRDCEAFVLVYSIASAESLRELATFRDQVLRVKDNDHVPLVVVGTQRDREEALRQVSYEEGAAFAKSVNAQSFFEVSAKDPEGGIEEAFFEAVRRTRNVRMRAHSSMATKMRSHTSMPKPNCSCQ